MMREILAAARASGGAVSGERGIGTAKVSYFLELADPVAVSLMRRIKDSFDPAGILNPGYCSADRCGDTGWDQAGCRQAGIRLSGPRPPTRANAHASPGSSCRAHGHPPGATGRRGGQDGAGR